MKLDRWVGVDTLVAKCYPSGMRWFPSSLPWNVRISQPGLNNTNILSVEGSGLTFSISTLHKHQITLCEVVYAVIFAINQL